VFLKVASLPIIILRFFRRLLGLFEPAHVRVETRPREQQQALRGTPTGRWIMNPIIWLLLIILLLAPRTALSKAGRLDWRAILLLMCVFTLLVRL